MDSNTPAIKKPKLEDRACCSADPAPPEQPGTHRTQVFLTPQITQFKDFKNAQTKVPRSSHTDSCDSGTAQPIYLRLETDTFEDDKPKSSTEPMVSKPHIGLSGTKTQYGKRCFESLSSADCLPIPKELYSILSEKESGNESGYSSQNTSYLKCQPLEKGVDNLLDNSEQLVDVENLETKQNSSSEETGNISSDKKIRFLRTASALQRSGLMEITIKTADILKQNRIVNREIERLHQDTLKFLQSVIKNPENKTFQETITKNFNSHS